MEDFYLERVNDSKRQVKYAKVGYEKEIRSLGYKLFNCKPEETDGIIAEINAAAKAMKELEWSYEYDLKAYKAQEAKNDHHE